VRIRIVTSVDKEAVLSLMDEFSEKYHQEDKPSLIGGHIFDEILKREDTMIFVAEENAKLLGLATFYLLPNLRHGWHRGHIEDFFITQSLRGKGIGTKIFNAIKEYCNKNNIKVIRLDSDVNLVSAHNFYEKNGGKFTEKMFRFDL
jgi:(aminoalkyl)phosphonate N-acetyltransferase